MREKYDPIACGLYDRLEAEATLKRTVRLTVKEDDGAVHQVTGLIRTFGAHDGVEHLILEDGTKIRLDKVTHLNGELFATNFC
jgi:Rho-binding antiterminator